MNGYDFLWQLCQSVIHGIILYTELQNFRSVPIPLYSGHMYNKVCVLITLKGSLSPRVLHNGTQAISICRRGHCHPGYSPMVPRQSQSYTCTYISNAEVVIVTQGTPQWYPGNLNPIHVHTLVMQKGGHCHPGYSPMVPRQS